MNTNDFALTILFGIKKFLAWIGIPSHMLDKMDELLFLIVIVIIAFIVAGIVHAVLVHLAKKILKRKRVGFFESMFKYSVFRKLTAIIPPLMVSALLPFAFSKDSAWFILSEKITWIYFFIALIISVNAILNTVGDELKKNKQLKNRPMKGFIQIFRVVFYCVVVIVIISILINKSPLNLITGLGAFTAVLMLVFKDTILGLVAGVMISEDDMLRIGDWIEMPQNNINGTVIDISLDVVKVQNFDNTIVTVPPYSLVSGSFINWRGMSDSGGRVLTDDNKSCFDDPNTIKSMEFVDKCVKNVMPPASTMSETGTDVLFGSGKVAMISQGSWMVSAFKDNDYIKEHCDVARLPKDAETGESVSIYNGLGWAASANTDMPDEAFQLIEWFGTKDMQQKQADLGVTMAAYEGMSDGWVNSVDCFNLQPYMDAMDNIVFRPHTNATLAWWNPMCEELKKPWNDEESMDDACKNIVTIMNDAIAEESY